MGVDQVRVRALIGGPVSAGRRRGKGVAGGAPVDQAIRQLAEVLYGRRLSAEQRAALEALIGGE